MKLYSHHHHHLHYRHVPYSVGFVSLCTMTTSHGTQSPSSASDPIRPSSQTTKPSVQRRRQRRRPRPQRNTQSEAESISSLARKYRNSPVVSDESELVGAESVSIQQSSRFPVNLSETVQQVAAAVEYAALEGHSRLRVDLRNPELVSKDRVSSVLSTVEALPPTSKTRQKRAYQRMQVLMEAANEMVKCILLCRDKLPGLGGTNIKSLRPPRGSLFFNSRADLELGKPMLHPDLISSVQLHALGEGFESTAAQSDVSVVLCPSNMHGNPGHIESIEFVHYSNWNNHNIVIVVNPSLVALTRLKSMNNELRPPSFLSDYLDAYYIDPVSYLARSAVGAILRCYPRKWEMYLLKLSTGNGFRLIGEQDQRPSREKLLCEFSWRVGK